MNAARSRARFHPQLLHLDIRVYLGTSHGPGLREFTNLTSPTPPKSSSFLTLLLPRPHRVAVQAASPCSLELQYQVQDLPRKPGKLDPKRCPQGDSRNPQSYPAEMEQSLQSSLVFHKLFFHISIKGEVS